MIYDSCGNRRGCELDYTFNDADQFRLIECEYVSEMVVRMELLGKEMDCYTEADFFKDKK